MLGCLTVLLHGLLCTQGLADSSRAKEWFLSAQDAQMLKGIYPQRILFMSVKGEAEDPKLIEVDSSAFNSLGFLELVEPSEVNFSTQINLDNVNKQMAASPPDSRERLIQSWFVTTHADTVILESREDGRWGIYYEDQGRPAIRAFKGRGPRDRSAAGIHTWLVENLGYTGIVLRAKGQFFLVARLVHAITANQILAIDRSSEQFVIPFDDRKGLGLLQHVESWGDISIFESLLVKGIGEIREGTKVLLPLPDNP